MAGGGGDGGHSLSLEETPTWAVAVVCFGFVFISVIIEESIHHLGKWLLKHQKKDLNEALEKVKAELMLLGFISLLLTVGQTPISKICISQKLAKTMVPCRKEDDSLHKTNAPETDDSLDGKVRKLLWEATSSSHEGRILAGGGGSNYCFKKIILLVGTKLQVIIAKLALEIHERHTTVQGTPVVQLGNELFWFGQPQWILFVIHFTLFQNAFEVAIYLWTWLQFGLASCFHEKIEVIIIRVAMGIFVQLLCGYITLPLYALVTQMGSHMKKAIFDDQTRQAVERWHQTARDHKKQNRNLGVTSDFISRETIPSQGSSPFALLRRSKTMADPESIEISQRLFCSEYEMPDLETSSSSQPPPQHSKSVRSNKANQNTQPTGQSLTTEDAENNNDDFSFEKV